LQLAVVQAGYGVAIADEVTLELDMAAPGSMEVYPLGHLLPKRIFGILMRKDGYLTPQAQAVLNFFKQRAEPL
jgi:DNA-binding transcriptional LysR family regulator